MKKIITILTLFFSLNNLFAQNNDENKTNNLIVVDELSYTDSDSGQGETKNDKKNGIWKYYYTDKTLWKQGKFKDDKEDGEWKIFYKNGNVRFIENYINGIKNGLNNSFYENGKLRIKSNYENGKLNGDFIEYFENGNIKSIQPYSNGEKTGKFVEFYKNGNVESEENFASNKNNREFIKYYENKNIKEQGFFVGNGYVMTGKNTQFYENGIVKLSILVDNDKLMEVYEYNDKNGNKLNTGTITNGSGTVNYYNEDGKLIGTLEFLNGKRKK